MKAKETASKTTAQILRDNVCTLFNLLNLLIAIDCSPCMVELVFYFCDCLKYSHWDCTGIESKAID